MAALWDRREAEPERSAYLNVVLGCVTSTPLENLQCSVSPTSAIPLTGTTMRNVLAGIFLFGLVSTALPANGYSVLTHEAIVDSAWNSDIKPLLLRRFPVASADNLRKAQAYAYGGAIIQTITGTRWQSTGLFR